MRKESMGKKSWTLPPVLLIFLTFIGLICIGTILLMMPFSNRSGEFFPFVDALFTATSAVCVTGLTVVDTLSNFTFLGQLVIAILIQCGGLGLMTIATLMFIYIGKKITLKDRLVLQEAYSDGNLTGLLKMTKNIIKITLLIELTGAFLLSMVFVPEYGFAEGAWKSVFHSISAFCNAGFDIFGGGTSLAKYSSNPYILLTISALIVCGGIGFGVLMDIIRVAKKKSNHLQTHSCIVVGVSATLILVGWVGFFLLEYFGAFSEMSLVDKLSNSLFQSITPRTAGFASVSQGDLGHLSRTLTTIFMFIGASPASTGGGIKTTTFMILLMVFIVGARGQEEVLIRGKKINHNKCFKAIAICIFAIIVIVVVSAAIYTIENYVGNPLDINDVYFETFSAFGTVGLSVGITSSLCTLSKIIISAVMLLGRLGTICLSLIFLGRNKKAHVQIKHAEAKINIG